MCLATIAAADLVSCVVAYSPVIDNLSHEDVMLELDLAMIKCEVEQSIAEDEERMEQDAFNRQIEMLLDFDDNIQINQRIDDDHKDQSSPNIISLESSHRHDAYDRNLADEFRRSEIESYFVGDMLRNDELFDDILKGGTEKIGRYERGNLRRRT